MCITTHYIELLHSTFFHSVQAKAVLVVGDDQHTALVVLDGQDQRSQTFAVQVVRWLIQNQHLRRGYGLVAGETWDRQDF